MNASNGIRKCVSFRKQIHYLLANSYKPIFCATLFEQFLLLISKTASRTQTVSNITCEVGGLLLGNSAISKIAVYIFPTHDKLFRGYRAMPKEWFLIAVP